MEVSLRVVRCAALIIGTNGVAAGWSDPAHADDMSLPLAPWVEENPVGELQLRVIQLTAGETLRLEPGVFDGPIIIRTPGVTIDGGGNAEIRGEGKGSVIIVSAPNVTLTGLKISGSGDSHDHVHAGVSVRQQSSVKVANNRITDCLFGIDVGGSKNVIVENNVVSSKDVAMMYRGDAIRVWNSSDIAVRGNHWTHSRDSVSWYSDRIKWENNRGDHSRYSLHSMYSRDLDIRGNVFHANSVGVFLMYGSGFRIENNVISRSTGITGIGIGTKEASGITALNNRIIYCTTGILLDNSPWDPGMPILVENNSIAFNGIGVGFAGDKSGATFRANVFRGNRADVDSESRQPSRAVWDGNSWDDYEGFDRNQDGVGDHPFRILKFTDTLAGSHPMAQYFFGAPVFLIIGLLERLLPPTNPLVMVIDKTPRILRDKKIMGEPAL